MKYEKVVSKMKRSNKHIILSKVFIDLNFCCCLLKRLGIENIKQRRKGQGVNKKKHKDLSARRRWAAKNQCQHEVSLGKQHSLEGGREILVYSDTYENDYDVERKKVMSNVGKIILHPLNTVKRFLPSI